MNVALDTRLVEGLGKAQGGVFTSADLRTALAKSSAVALHRRIRQLEEVGVLRRFCRGLYVTESFDPATLSQRIAPDSAISFETVLAAALVIGPKPKTTISAIRGGAGHDYEHLGLTVIHHRLNPSLRFGEKLHAGLRYTLPEKALLDVLYFHLRGRRALFDIYSDVNRDRLDRSLLRKFTARYSNPKFRAFASEALEL